MSDPRYQVDVSVVTRHLPEQSNPEQKRYAFAYTVTIQNNGAVAAKLLSRHWIITDGDGRVQEVRGAGVVGQQPAGHGQLLRRAGGGEALGAEEFGSTVHELAAAVAIVQLFGRLARAAAGAAGLFLWGCCSFR